MNDYREEVENALRNCLVEYANPCSTEDHCGLLELGVKLGLQEAAKQLRISAELLQTLEESFAARSLVVAAEGLERSDPADVLRKEKP